MLKSAFLAPDPLPSPCPKIRLPPAMDLATQAMDLTVRAMDLAAGDGSCCPGHHIAARTMDIAAR
eukprot:5095146-Lingulodinium_polyedra.AAC.1